MIDGIKRGMEAKADRVSRINKPIMQQEPPDFVDVDPGRPLFQAIYSRKYAMRLIEDTGWELKSLNDPEECIQHYMICKPA